MECGAFVRTPKSRTHTAVPLSHAKVDRGRPASGLAYFQRAVTTTTRKKTSTLLPDETEAVMAARIEEEEQGGFEGREIVLNSLLQRDVSIHHPAPRSSHSNGVRRRHLVVENIPCRPIHTDHIQTTMLSQCNTMLCSSSCFFAQKLCNAIPCMQNRTSGLSHQDHATP